MLPFPNSSEAPSLRAGARRSGAPANAAATDVRPRRQAPKRWGGETVRREEASQWTSTRPPSRGLRGTRAQDLGSRMARLPRPPSGGQRAQLAGRRTAMPAGSRLRTTQEAMPAAAMRVQKLLASHGRGSRREIEDLMKAGRVTINGVIARLGDRASTADRITVDGSPVHLESSPTGDFVLLYHKPAGEVVSRDDPEGRATVFDHLPRVPGGRWIAVGRLDYNSSGLLLLTTSGELAARLMHPRHEIEREYAVRVLGTLSSDQRRRLLEGVELEGGVARFDRLQEGGGEGTNRWYTVGLHEGRNREVRRLFEAVGLTVSRLIRVGFGPVRLPKDLPRGHSRLATPAELSALARAVEMQAAPPVSAQRPAGAARPSSRRRSLL